MANVPLIQTWQGQVGLAKETTWGTYTAPAAANQFVFHKSVKVEDIINDEPDESYQGVRSKTQGFYQGFRYAKVTMDFYVAQLNIGNFLMAFFGQDTKTGASDPFTHTFTELDTGAPPSYTISNYDATIATTRAVEGAYLQDLTLSYADKGLFMGNAVFLGKYVDVAQTKPTATYDTAPHYIPYQNALTLNGTSNAKLVALKLQFHQDVIPQFGASGTQDVTAFSVGTIDVTGDLTFDSTDNTEIQLYRANTQGAFSALFTNTASHTLTLQMTKCAFKNGTIIDQSAAYAKVTAKIEGIRNTTDAGMAKVVLLNSLSTAY